MSDFFDKNWKFFAGAAAATILTSFYFSAGTKEESGPI